PVRPSSTLFPYTTLFRSLWPHAPRQPSRRRLQCPFHRVSKTFCERPLKGRGTRPLVAAPGGRSSRCRAAGQTRFAFRGFAIAFRSEEHTSELQSRFDLVC